jgi:hypothetical protein
LFCNGFHHVSRKLEKFPPGRGEGKGAPLKQGDSPVFLQPGDLAAYRRLLDSIGHVAHGFRNPPVPRDLIEQFEMMDIHRFK